MNTDFDDFRGQTKGITNTRCSAGEKTNFRHIFQLAERDFNSNLLQTLLETNKPTSPPSLSTKFVRAIYRTDAAVRFRDIS